MKFPFACCLALALPVLTWAASSLAPAHRMFAAASLTKEQKNSPTAADFGLFERMADGSWQPFGPRISCSGLTVGPDNPAVMLVPSSDGIVRSDDGGKTWRNTTGWDVADVHNIVFDPLNPRQAYASTAWGPLRSTDGGETWQPAQQGLAKLYCQTVLADPLRVGRVLLGTEDGIYVSTDAALSWTRVPSPATTILRLARSGADGQLLLAGTQGRGAWLSHDDGTTWSAVDAASDKADFYAAALDPDNAAVMAVGGWGVGVRLSADGGATWADRSAGLPVKNVFVLAFDPGVKNRLWASTFEEGTYYSDDLGRTWKNGGLYGAYGSDFIFLPPARP